MPRQERTDWDRSADLEQIKATYQRYADSGRGRLWDQHNAGYARLAAQLRRQLIALMGRSLGNGPARVLDLGCGTGGLALDAAAAAYPVEWVGVDLRPDAIETARTAFPQGRFAVASADDVSEPSSSFDIVVAQVLFSSLPSEALESAVAAEIGRLLKPGGWLLWTDLRYSNPRNTAVHGLGTRRVQALFPGWRTELDPVGLLPPIARRLGRAAWLWFPILSSIPPLRSHLVGRLQRPSQPGPTIT